MTTCASGDVLCGAIVVEAYRLDRYDNITVSLKLPFS